MIKKPPIDEICDKLSEVLPSGFKESREKCHDQFKSILSAAFEKLDLVTREEFDAQCDVLKKTREKLAQLEKQLKERD